MKSMHRIALWALVAVLASCAARSARADDAKPPPATKEGIEFFEKNIRPVLAQSCYRCHNSKSPKASADLRLDSWAGIAKGGESGRPIIVPGKPDESLLIIAIRYTDKDTDDHDAVRMPPKKHGKSGKLPDDVIKNFEQWVKMGAPYPDAAAEPTTQPSGQSSARPAGNTHWAFVKPVMLALPGVHDSAWVRQPIDRFVLAQLEARGNPNYDHFTWAPTITSIPDAQVWNAADQFGNPPPPQPMTAWERYVQVLLESDEFVYVD